MSERSMRKTVITHLKDLDAQAVENSVHPGTADVNYVEGWIELKYIPRWPKKADSIVPLPHFTPQQRVWLARRFRKNGNVFLLLKVAKDWLLFDGLAGSMLVGRVTKKELLWGALVVWERSLPEGELRRALELHSQR